MSATEFGYHLQSKAEGLAFQKLEKPITGQATIGLKYRSAAKGQKTRNGAIVISDQPTNQGSLKIGTAIGMNQHVVFEGGWNNVGSLAAKKIELKPGEVFELEVRLDMVNSKGKATINGTSFTFDLPRNLKTIRHVGLYNKATATEFTEPIVEIQSR